jgi:transcriptional regulator with XRE-family HTH domain
MNDSPRLQLYRAMKARRTTVQRLARVCCLDPSTVGRIRAGRQTPSAVTAALIADALGTTPDALGLGKGGAA